MTRNDAMRLLKMNRIVGATPEIQFLSWAEGLGFIKFDEPLESRESPTYKAYDTLFPHIPSLSFLTFKELLTSAGLQITKKQEQ
jgi:hypothetical protein